MEMLRIAAFVGCPYGDLIKGDFWLTSKTEGKCSRSAFDYMVLETRENVRVSEVSGKG